MTTTLRKREYEEEVDDGDVVDGAGADDQKKKKLVVLHQLFNYSRFTRPYSFKHLLFALWLPIGAALWPIRLVGLLVTFLLVLGLPKSIAPLLNPLMQLFMGLRVKYNGLENVPNKSNRIIVCNHLTDFDPYPLFLLLKSFHVLVAAHIRKVPIVGKLYEKMDTIYVDQNNKVKARQDVLDGLEKTDLPLLIYPEGGLTNGKKGMMMFNKFVFSIGHGIVPVAMKMNNPWPTNVDYLGSSWTKNFFWWILVPYHVFELTFLPHMRIAQGETDAEFAKRVQQRIADHLSIEATDLPYSEKKKLGAKLLSGEFKPLINDDDSSKSSKSKDASSRSD